MNWVGGARNRIKLKHEKKLQKEFFERKRQQKKSFSTITLRNVQHKQKTNSQDLFSLEVIMSAHKNGPTKTLASKTSSPQNHDKENITEGDITAHGTEPHFWPLEQSATIQQQLSRNFTEDKCEHSCADPVGGRCIFGQLQSCSNRTNEGDITPQTAGQWGGFIELEHGTNRNELWF